MREVDSSKVKFDSTGLVPVVTQDANSGAVLMLAYTNKACLEETIALGEMVYFSRSRNERWHKGDTSGNIQKVVSLSLDCDGDTILAKVEAAGPACHNGTFSCFEEN
ncbi:MAG: phosphoribosyl-AMP cyclohydrolase [Aquiluna sp.]|nr:phosphoribosyl-AMP cyclohydrolase [Aquiluna sp.]MCF8545064.1 phosphoribosyl-AMP cyclohydrolase [Aquiluna sp.]